MSDVGSDISPWRRRWLTSLIAVVLVGLVLSVVLFVHWIYNPAKLANYASAGANSSSPLNKTIYIDDMIEPPSVGDTLDLDFRSIKAKLGANSAQATVEIFLCTSTNGFDFSVVKAACTTRTVFKPGSVKLGTTSSAANAPDREYIVAVTPHAVGSFDLQGLQVSYHSGIRRGDQHTGYDVRVKVTAS